MLVLSTIAVHIFVGIPVSFAMLVKNTTLALFGAQARPREPIAVAVIGASSGLGRALAMQYATPGRKMLLIARDEQRLFEVAEACRAKGAEANWRSIDITDPDSSLEKELADFHEAYGLDLLIDIAGIVYQSEPDAGEYWTQSYKKIFSTNVLGMVRAGVCAADLMRKAGRGGQIAWMGSIDAWQAYPSRGFGLGSATLFSLDTHNPQTSSTQPRVPQPHPWAKTSVTYSAATTSLFPPFTLAPSNPR